MVPSSQDPQRQTMRADPETTLSHNSGRSNRIRALPDGARHLHRQRQPAQTRQGSGKTPEQGKGQTGFRRGKPASATAATASRLAIRHDHRSGWRTAFGAAHQFAIGRVAFVQRINVETPGQQAEPGFQENGIKQCHAADFTPPLCPCRPRCRDRQFSG